MTLFKVKGLNRNIILSDTVYLSKIKKCPILMKSFDFFSERDMVSFFERAFVPMRKVEQFHLPKSLGQLVSQSIEPNPGPPGILGQGLISLLLSDVL